MDSQRGPCKRCGRAAQTHILEARDGICIPCSRAQREAALRQAHVQTSTRASLYPTAMLLLANKSPAYQARILAAAEAIAEFYTERQLASCDLRGRFRAAPEAFQLSPEDLTAQGRAFTAQAFQNWLKQHRPRHRRPLRPRPSGKPAKGL